MDYYVESEVAAWVIWAWVLGALVASVVCGAVTVSLARARHRPAGWFWAGFFLGLVGILWIAFMPPAREGELAYRPPTDPAVRVRRRTVVAAAAAVALAGLLVAHFVAGLVNYFQWVAEIPANMAEVREWYHDGVITAAEYREWMDRYADPGYSGQAVVSDIFTLGPALILVVGVVLLLKRIPVARWVIAGGAISYALGNFIWNVSQGSSVGDYFEYGVFYVFHAYDFVYLAAFLATMTALVVAATALSVFPRMPQRELVGT